MRPSMLCLVLTLGLCAELVGQDSGVLQLEYRIGSLDDPRFAFGRIVGLAVSDHGETFVADQMNARVVVFGRSGDYVRSFGRRGSGPGEFLRLAAVGRLGDSIWVVDQQNLRITYFSTAGDVRGTRRFVYDPPSPFHAPTVPQALLSSGLAIVDPYGVSGSGSPPPANQKTSVVWVDPSGSPVDTLLERPRSAGLIRLSSGGVAVFQPYLDTPLWDVDEAGSFVARVDRAAAADPSQGLFRVRLQDSAGATIYDRQYSYKPVMISQQLTDSLVTAFTAEIQPYDRSNRLGQDIWDGIYVPRFHPTVTAIGVGVDGMVFLRREDRFGTFVAWTTLDRSGNPRTNFLAPHSFRIFHAEGDELIGVEQDSLDVNYVAKYRLVSSTSVQ